MHIYADGKLKFKRQVAKIVSKLSFQKQYGLITKKEAEKEWQDKLGYRDDALTFKIQLKACKMVKDKEGV